MNARRIWQVGGGTLLAFNCALWIWLLWPNLDGSDGRLRSPTHAGAAYERENATLYTLCRNEDLGALAATAINFEDRFNWRYHYPWVFMNNEEFSQEFKDVMRSVISGEVHFVRILQEHWGYPEWIDQDKAAEGRRQLSEQGIIYAESESYRHMCRFNSGFYYRQPIMLNYDYSWRVEPDTRILCDIDFDVFRYMRVNRFKYGFTIALHEFYETVASLWPNVLRFISNYPSYVNPDNLARFITEDGGKSYNMCHFWNNFHIADLNFFRSEAYSQYFAFLDRMGGFFYERWGDAPVHSIAASLFLSRDEITHLDMVGYNHPPYQHIPSDSGKRDLRCAVNPSDNFDWTPFSCLRHYYTARDQDYLLPAGIPKVLY